MPVSYNGQSQRNIETYNFGGINKKATIVNLKDGEASDITNFDIDITGGIKLRSGRTVTASSLGANPKMYVDFFKQDGTEVYCAIAGGKFWESTDRAMFTDRTNGKTITLTNNPHNSTDFNGKLYWGNGLDQPFVFTPGSGMLTMKEASLLSAPAAPKITSTGTNLIRQWQYVITSVGGQGESTPSGVANIFSGPDSLTPLSANTLTWTPVVGAVSQRIYRYDSAGNAFYKIAEVSGLATAYTDAGDTADTFTTPPTVNAAYNTPKDWEDNGAPQGFSVLSRGKDQRLVAWRNDYFWISALNNGLDWFNVDGSPIQITGAKQNNIKAIVTLFDFTVVFTPTNSFFYAGYFPDTFYLNKMTGVGCVSPKSIVQLADDIFLWSQYGPTSISRINLGADIKSNPMSVKVSPIVYGSNTNRWDLISAYLDLNNQRIVWAFPGTPSDTYNNTCLVFQYTIMAPDGSIGAWTKYGSWNVVQAIRCADNTISALLQDGTINTLSTGTTDNGAAITGTYQTAFFSLDTYRKKRLMWVDLLMDGTVSYNMNVSISGDYGRANETSSHTVTQSTTDGLAITTTGSSINEHRIYTKGDSRAYQMVFTVTSSPQPPQIIGFRFEARFKGVR